MFGERQQTARLTRLRRTHPCIDIAIGVAQTGLRP